MEAWGREEELWDHTGLGRMDSNHRSRDLEDGQVPGIPGSWGQRCLPTFVWDESGTTWLLEEAQDGLHPRRLERVTWGMEGGHISPPWLGEGAPHPRSMGRMCPQEGKQSLTAGHAGAASSCRELRGGQKDAPLHPFFLPPLCYSGREEM